MAEYEINKIELPNGDICHISDGGGGGDVNVIEAISFNGANVPPDASKRVSMSETDPTVPAWAKASTKPAYTAAEVGALPAETPIPTLERTSITSQITVNNSHVRTGTANAFLIGGLGILSFSLDIDSSLANNTILLTFASTLNIQGLYVMGALFKSTAAVATTASVWFERVNGATAVKYYQTSTPSNGQYFAQLIFMLKP